jgi:hypothetical protein
MPESLPSAVMLPATPSTQAGQCTPPSQNGPPGVGCADKDHHEGYITRVDFLANEARLAANHTAARARPAREGIALCQGIIVCGSCGKPMVTNYHTG